MSLTISARAQTALVWWAWIFMVIFGLSYYFLLRLLPLPPATRSAAEIAAFYSANGGAIRFGAIICSYTGAFMVPLTTVVAVQLARLEKGVPIWAILSFGGGMMMSMFLVLPPLLWGVAAFTPSRPPEVTLLMHEYANLMLVTTDQYFIFQNIAIVVVSLTQQVDEQSPFPRWFGYFTLFVTLMDEAGAIAFAPKSGLLAWNGLLAYWVPLTLYGTWLTVISLCLLGGIRRQAAAEAAQNGLLPLTVPSSP